MTQALLTMCPLSLFRPLILDGIVIGKSNAMWFPRPGHKKESFNLTSLETLAFRNQPAYCEETKESHRESIRRCLVDS